MNITRRQFISWGLAAGAVAGVQGAGYAFFGHVMRTASRMDTPVPTVCRACSAGCGIVGYLRGGKRLVAIMGNPEHPASRGKLCAQAMAAVNLHYHPERLLRPRAAAGGKLDTAAAVDQAGRTIARLIGMGARVVVDTWDEQPAQAALLNALGANGKMIGRESMSGYNRRVAMETVWGGEVRPDFERADLLLVFGADPLAGGPRFIQDVREIIDARVERGAKMIVFDPRLSNTAGRADCWLPIRPGTDHIAALALWRFVLENSRDGGYMPIWAPYDLATAANICGVSQELLADAGRMIIASREPATMVGEGIFRQPSFVEVYRAIVLLDAMNRPNQVPIIPSPPLAPEQMMMTPAEAEELYAGLESGQVENLVLITHRANPVYERGPALERALRAGKVVYHLSITPFPNETANLAHLVIPEALPLESEARVWQTAYVTGPTYVRQQPVVPPPEGVWTAAQIFSRLSVALGGTGEVDTEADLVWMRGRYNAKNFVEIGQGIFAADVEYKPAVSHRVVPPNPERLPAPPPEPADRWQLLLHGSAVTNRDSAMSKWLAEIEHAGQLFLHPDDARRLRVREGDRVRISGRLPAGPAVQVDVSFTTQVRVFVSDGIRPGCVALVEGQGHSGAGKLAAAKRFTTALDPDMDLLWWADEGNGANLAPFARADIDPATGLPAGPLPLIKIEVP